MAKFEKFTRNAKIRFVRRRSMPPGMFIEVKKNRFGRQDREVLVTYPAGSLGDKPTTQRMVIRPDTEFDDLEVVSPDEAMRMREHGNA